VEIEGAEHRSSTVEKTDVSRHVDCAVIDEIQMIGDVNRGHAWTRALLGVPAQTVRFAAQCCAGYSDILCSQVYLCGDESALELIEEICEINNDMLSVVRHERLGSQSACAKG
jgi:ATP-dependent RNA helicase SUPV3L1/SUV3